MHWMNHATKNCYSSLANKYVLSDLVGQKCEFFFN